MCCNMLESKPFRCYFPSVSDLNERSWEILRCGIILAMNFIGFCTNGKRPGSWDPRCGSLLQRHAKTIEDQQIAGLVWFGQHCPHCVFRVFEILWVGLDSAWKFCCRLGLIANSKAYWEGMQPATPWELAPWRDIERFIVYSVSRHAFPLRCPQHAEHRGVMMCSPRTNNNKQ